MTKLLITALVRVIDIVSCGEVACESVTARNDQSSSACDRWGLSRAYQQTPNPAMSKSDTADSSCFELELSKGAPQAWLKSQ